MTNIELLTKLKKSADNYGHNANTSIHINNHMNNITTNKKIDQDIIDAILVDFINYIGMQQGVDYALYTRDLYPIKE